MFIHARKALLAVTAAASLCCAGSQAATITINVGASPSIASSLVDLIGSFQAYYFASGVSYNIAVTVDTNANLESAITGGTTPAFDLLLTDSDATAADLTAHYAGYVQGTPFAFAHDTLTVYSISKDNTAVATGLPEEFKGQAVVADPTSDAYGAQAAVLLARDPWQFKTIPGKSVAVQPDNATARVGVELGLYPYAVLANSAVCSNLSGTAVYPDGSFVHTLATAKGTTARINLSGLATAVATRTAAQATELTNFINFLTGVGTTQGTDVLLRSCYTLQ